MTAPAQTRFQKAAIMLHRLSRRDQAWLLKRLLPAARSVLRPLLNELRELGIGAGVGMDDAPPPAMTGNVALNQAAVAAVDATASAQATAVLARQPEPLQAVLLAMHDWRWKAAFWDSLSLFQRSTLTGLTTDAPQLRPLMLDALLQAFAAELALEPASAAQPGVQR